MTTENPQAFAGRSLSIFFSFLFFFFRGGKGGGGWGREHYDMYDFFSVKQNFKDISLTVIEERNSKKIKTSNFNKTFEDIIENELDFHGYSTGKMRYNNSQFGGQ